MNLDNDFKGANEIGKIFNSFMDKKLLCDFFLDSVLTFIPGASGHLFLLGNQNQLWLESANGPSPIIAEQLKSEAEAVYRRGQPVSNERILVLPLIVRNSAIGSVCFFHRESGQKFSEKEFALAQDLTYQLAGALQNILLFEQNMKMERLAAIGQTTSMVMHELTNILQLGKLADDCLRRGLSMKNDKLLDRGLAGIKKALHEMDGFAYEMLSLTKDYRIKPVEMDLTKILGELQSDLEEKAHQAHVTLDFQSEAGLKTEGEPRSLFRALLNITKNAIEAADKPDAYIRIRARSLNPEQYEIRIDDNGQGMTDEVKARIFQAFFSTKGQRGTGLGLMIIDKTVKAHGGAVRVESESGKGTSFILTLPKKLPPP